MDTLPTNAFRHLTRNNQVSIRPMVHVSRTLNKPVLPAVSPSFRPIPMMRRVSVEIGR